MYRTRMSRTPSASTSATAGQVQRRLPRRPDTQPIRMDGDNPAKVVRKLKAYRSVVESSGGLSSFLPSGEPIPVGIDSSAPFLGAQNPQHSRGQASGYASTAKTSRAASEGSYETYVFSAKNGETKTENGKKPLDPKTKARKDLFRTFGKCLFDCREKKVKCWISHHSLEDIVDIHPEAMDDVLWALAVETDPKQRGRSTPAMSRSLSQRLQTHPEEDEKTTVIDRATAVLPIDTSMTPSYDLFLELDIPNEDDDYDDSVPLPGGSMVHNPLRYPLNDISCQRRASAGDYQRNMPRPESANLHFSSEHSFQQSDIGSDLGLHSPQQSLFDNYGPISSSSQGYLSPPSAPQSQTYGTSDMLFQSFSPLSFTPAVYPTEVVLAAILPASYLGSPTTFRCIVSVATCSLTFQSIEDMTTHLQQCHRGYDLASMPQVRAACSECFSLHHPQQPLCQNPACLSGQGVQASKFQLILCGTHKTFQSRPSDPPDLGFSPADITEMLWNGMHTSNNGMNNDTSNSGTSNAQNDKNGNGLLNTNFSNNMFGFQ